MLDDFGGGLRNVLSLVSVAGRVVAEGVFGQGVNIGEVLDTLIREADSLLAVHSPTAHGRLILFASTARQLVPR